MEITEFSKHLIVIGTAVLLLAVGLSGCTTEKRENLDAPKFFGYWTDVESGEIYIFYSNLTLLVKSSDGNDTTQITWSWSSGQLIIRNETRVESLYNNSFNNNDARIDLTDTSSGYSFILTRQ